MKIRIIKQSSYISEELLDEAKEDDLYDKYWGGDEFLQRDFRDLLMWVYGNPNSGSGKGWWPLEYLMKNFKEKGKAFAPERQNRIKYLNWATKMHRGNYGIKQIVDALDKYHKNSQSFPRELRNISAFEAPSDIEEAWYKHVILKRAAKRRKSRAGLLKKGVLGSDEQEFIYKDDTIEVVRPYTVHASCQYGKGTEWCIAQKDVDDDTGEVEYNRWFDDYTQNEAKIFYFILDDSRKSNDKYYKVTIQVSLDLTGDDEDAIVVDGYWDLTDNAGHQVPLPIEKLKHNKVYKEGVLDKIMASILEHAKENPPVKGELAKLNKLYNDIYDGKYDNQYIRFTADMSEENALGIGPVVMFNFVLPMVENHLDKGGPEDDVWRAWESSLEAGLEEALEEYILDIQGMDYDAYRNSYNDIGDIIDLSSKTISVEAGLAFPYFDKFYDAVDYIEDLKNHYYFETIANMESDLTDKIQSYMKQYLNIAGREGIQNLAKKIWALNSRFKYFETNYHDEGDEDLAISFETKKPYIIPLKFPTYPKKVKGYSADLTLASNVDSFLKAVSTIARKKRIKDAFAQAIDETHQKVMQAAADQMKINFPNIDPPEDYDSTKNRPKIRVDVSMPSVQDIRGKADAPQINVRLALVVTDEDDPMDILWSAQYVQMLDSNWDEIIEKFLKLFDIDKRQEQINIIFRNKVLHKDEEYLKSKGLQSGAISERKKTIKVKLR